MPYESVVTQERIQVEHKIPNESTFTSNCGMGSVCSVHLSFSIFRPGTETILHEELTQQSTISINLLAYYHDCRSLIGYATRYLLHN